MKGNEKENRFGSQNRNGKSGKGKMLNYNQLYYFYQIAKEGSLGKAARLLNVSQPALSQQLSQFEKWAGQELFHRKGRSVKLNSQGQFVFRLAHDMFDLSEQIYLGLTYATSHSEKDAIRIGITPVVSRLFSVTLLNPVMEKNRMLIIKNDDFAGLIDRLFKREVDFILNDQMPQTPKDRGLKWASVQNYRYCFVCSPEIYKEGFKESDLSGLPYFKFPIDSLLQRNIEHYFLSRKIRPMVCGESDDLNVVISATEKNHCFSVLPEAVIGSQLANGTLIKLFELETYNSHIQAIFLEDFSNKKITDVISKLSVKIR